jgi:hypothetical protein
MGITVFIGELLFRRNQNARMTNQGPLAYMEYSIL